MSFLKRFFDGSQESHRQESVDGRHVQPSEVQVESHLQVSRYGDFELTEAIRPSMELEVVPRQGYRRDTYTDPRSGSQVPLLTVAASAEILFELFLDLLDPLGPVVDMVLETSHVSDAGEHADMYRDHIDLPVLKSLLWDFEDLLTHDGCTGIAVLNPRRQLEVQFDEHKLLLVYGKATQPFEQILQSYSVLSDTEIRFLTEADHVHSSSDEFRGQFDRLSHRIGAEGACEI